MARKLPADRLDKLLVRRFVGVPQIEKALGEDWRVDDKTSLSIADGGTYSVVDRDNALYINSGPKIVTFGTGSTPTLMGFGADADKLVIITGGADHMKLLAFWRERNRRASPARSP